jgi:hypothetical protein
MLMSVQYIISFALVLIQLLKSDCLLNYVSHNTLLHSQNW